MLRFSFHRVSLSYVRSLRCLSFFATTVLLTALPCAHAFPLVELGRNVLDHGVASAESIAAHDLDGDGFPEVILVSSGPRSLVVIAGAGREGRWQVKQAWIPDVPEWSKMLALSAVIDGDPSLVLVVEQHGVAIVHQGWPLREVRRFDVGSRANAAFADDVDGNGNPELIVTQTGSTRAYDLSSGALLWTYPFGGSAVVGVSDGERPGRRIVIADYSGVILDGITRSVVWSYPQGFGYRLAAGRIGAGGAMGFVGLNSMFSVDAFGDSPWSPWWSLHQTASSIATGDVDGDGRDEIILGDWHWRYIRVLDSLTQETRLTIDTGSDEIGAVRVVDLHADGIPKIVASTGEHSIHVFDGLDGSSVWRLGRSRGVRSVAVGDIDGSGREKVVIAIHGETSRLLVADAESGAVLSTMGENDALPFVIDALEVTKAGDGVGGSIVAVTREDEARVVMIDSVTNEVAWTSDALWSTSHRALGGTSLLDINGDGYDDLVIVSHAVSTGSSNGAVQVVCLRSGEILWDSGPIGTSFLRSVAVHTVSEVDDTVPSIVATFADGARAYRAGESSPTWVVPFPASVAAIVEGPDGEPELVLGDSNGNVLHVNLTDGSLARTYALPSRIRSIAGLEGEPGRMLVEANGRLRLIDTLVGAELGRSDVLGSLVAFDRRMAVVRHNRGWRVTLGSEYGYFVHHVHPSSAVFVDGFGPAPGTTFVDGAQ